MMPGTQRLRQDIGELMRRVDKTRNKETTSNAVTEFISTAQNVLSLFEGNRILG